MLSYLTTINNRAIDMSLFDTSPSFRVVVRKNSTLTHSRPKPPEPHMPRPRRTRTPQTAEGAAAGQLTLDLSAPVVKARPARTPPAPLTASTRYFTRLEAAAYIRCSPRFLDGLQLPFIREGRCKVYDRIDLDAHTQDDRQRGRAWKEILWPVNVDSTAARIRDTGGSTSFSPTDDDYARALGVSIAPTPPPTSSA
jgi:hypothetical protein